MDKKQPSLCFRLEQAITSYFYNGGEGRSKALRMGLQVPLWLWTHQITVESEREGRELQKIVHLVHWFYENGVNVADVVIIVPGDVRPKLRAQLTAASRRKKDAPLPVILAPYELTAMNARDKVLHRFEAVLYLLHLPPMRESLAAAVQQEQFLGDAVAGARGAFVLIADAGWTSPLLTSGWSQWRTFVMKLQEETPLISAEDPSTLPSDARLPSLVGPRIPLCCPRHPNERQFEHGAAPPSRACGRLCLSPFACQRVDHVCLEPCHPLAVHNDCPYACQSQMPCGHECLQSCSERCNCFEMIEYPLKCSHETVIGLDQSSLQPIYSTVRHIFKGYCSDAQLPCAVEFHTECARCLGSFATTCAEATQQNHTLENKTMLCPSCVRLEREVRAKVLGEILVQTEEAKRRMKVEVQRSLHQQRKASSQGLFQEGSRVTICDITKVVKPLCPDADFPGVVFADYDAPDFYSTVDGAYGTFISRHVDIDDLSEVRNLIRLRDGQHVLVADGGVRLIRALTTSITQQAPMLLLTYDSSGSSAPDAETLARAARMVGRLYYLALPIPFDGSVVSDKVVRVTGVDPTSPGRVLAECLVPVVEAHGGDAEMNGAPPFTRPRLEGDTRPTPRALLETLHLVAPISALEPMDGYSAGKEVLVLDPSRQVTAPHDVEAFSCAMDVLPSLDLRGAVVSAVPVARDTPFVLLGVINPPRALGERYGPCAVLRRVSVRAVVPTRRAVRRPPRNGRLPPPPTHTSAPAGPRADDGAVVLVPFVFTAADELLEAEHTLDAAAQEQFERRVREVITERSEELAIRHDEEAFHAQRRMPEVTDADTRRARVAYSCPIPLPTPESRAAVRTRRARLPCASDIALRVSRQKDTLAAKKERFGLRKWLEAARIGYQQESNANTAYIKAIDLKNATRR